LFSLATKCVTDLDERIKETNFESILTTFKLRVVFRGRTLCRIFTFLKSAKVVEDQLSQTDWKTKRRFGGEFAK